MTDKSSNRRDAMSDNRDDESIKQSPCRAPAPQPTAKEFYEANATNVVNVPRPNHPEDASGWAGVRRASQAQFIAKDVPCMPLWDVFDFAEKYAAAPAPQPVERSDKDYAIEHAEYLAKAAEHLMDEINKYDMAESTDEEDDCDARSDAWNSLRSAIGEFRKRAKRAEATPQVTPTEEMCDSAIDLAAALRVSLKELARQVEISNAMDDHGHPLRNLKALHDAKKLLEGTSEQAPQELELEQEADGRWLAAYTRFPGVAAYGPSKEEAIRNAAKVLIESTPEQASYPNDPSLMCAEGRHKECIGSNQPWWVCGCACHKKASEQASPSTGVSLDGGKTIHSKFKND